LLRRRVYSPAPRGIIGAIFLFRGFLMPPLSAPQSAAAILEMYYLEARCHLLETAAIFDRLDRAAGAAEIKNDSRYRRLRQALTILQSETGGRVPEFLTAFSDGE
jgi:hypothetical protein